MSSSLFLPSIFQQPTTTANNTSFYALMFLILVVGIAVMVYMFLMNKEKSLHTAFGDTSGQAFTSAQK